MCRGWPRGGSIFAAMQHRPDVLVIGGGVVGLACGLALQQGGRDVLVVEADT
ncbi:MAG TPA: FAD-dependent oxidoreductase, partial [Luteimonas sp.]